MKIAFTSTYSWPSISGVWTRVENLALEMIKRGHEVHAFTSNLKAGTTETLPDYELYKGIHIHRYPVKRMISKNAGFWTSKNMKQDVLDLKPDVIDCQTYRHPESNFTLKLNKKLKTRIFLTTHAPFVAKELRGRKLSLIVRFYDAVYRKTLNQFNKIIAITRWEMPYLHKLGARKDKIVLIPNGIPDEFFKTRIKKGKGVLFLGRVSPIKDIETLVKAFKLVQERHNLQLNIVGPLEEPYGAEIVDLVKKLGLNHKTKAVQFSPPVFNLKKKIKIFDSCEIFVLPSKREGMPQALIEAMARGKIVISSQNQGGKEIIKHGKNGFLFDIGNVKQLAELIDKIMNLSDKEKGRIKNQAKLSVKNLSWSKIARKIEKIYKG